MNTDLIIVENHRIIKIGIIDSGIDSKAFCSCLISGGSIRKIDDNYTFMSGEYQDEIGHGTGIAGIIYKNNSYIDMFIIKVFYDSLIADAKQLSIAISQCVDNGCSIINISAGCFHKNDELERACQYAYDKNVCIVAAYSNGSGSYYPASYPNCIGVWGVPYHKKKEFYIEIDQVEGITCYARGDMQRVKWINDQSVFMSGDSFAAAHITSIISQLLSTSSVESLENLVNKMMLLRTNNLPIVATSRGEYHLQTFSQQDREEARQALKDYQFILWPETVIAYGGKSTIDEKNLKLLSCKIKNFYEDSNLFYKATQQLPSNIGLLLIDKLPICAIKDVNWEKVVSRQIISYHPDAIDYMALNIPVSLCNKEKEVIFDLPTYECISKKIRVESWEVRSPIVGIIGDIKNKESYQFDLAVQHISEKLRSIGYRVVRIDANKNVFLYEDGFSFPIFSITSDVLSYPYIIRYIEKLLDFIYEPDIIIVSGNLYFSDSEPELLLKSYNFLFAATLEAIIPLNINEHYDAIRAVVNSFTKAPIISSKTHLEEYTTDYICDDIIAYFSESNK